MDHNDHDSDKSLVEHIDLKVTEGLSRWGQRGSRRNFLTRLGKLTIAAVVGSSMAAVLPVDRRVALAWANRNCTRWNWCGLGGYPCACAGGGDSTCPGSNCRISSYWAACCTNPAGARFKIYYYDCCRTTSSSNDCGGTSYPSCECNNHSGTAWWCDEAATYGQNRYRCTQARDSGVPG